MSSVKDLREARRRKILERGNDRLAFITGQVKALSPAEPSSVVGVRGESGLKSLSIAGELPSSSEDPLPTSSPLNVPNAIPEESTSVETELHSPDPAPAEETPLLSPLISAPASSTLQQKDIAPATKSRVVSSPKSRSNFDYATLGKSIDHSIAIRAILSFFIGISLVFQWAYSKCQRTGAFGSQRYILSWPVFLVIISDLTIVVAAPLLGFIKVPPASVKGNPADRGGLEALRDPKIEQMLAFTSNLEGALDLGLLVTKAARGVMSDISLYLVTMICAVSIAQHYQPALCTYISR
ncbi:uncharacterized protein [Physcomitrium patens]|uniref:Uncharacterized protein n=1 Tax=Physcomitrium patens TaxID=3218 RepID=A0A2K1L416_PHYPA|nr:uncharacterized protein LOC112295034 [Physcomitrium patens]PNR60769.1 hypothetical protein PHYPA_003562 [Physcomitrium patens]|eukprot:XP_024401908.1 uncharacterized protein LOC112295034 [Physcomitrella patens]